MQITILYRSTHLSGAVMAGVASRTRTLVVVTNEDIRDGDVFECLQ